MHDRDAHVVDPLALADQLLERRIRFAILLDRRRCDQGSAQPSEVEAGRHDVIVLEVEADLLPEYPAQVEFQLGVFKHEPSDLAVSLLSPFQPMMSASEFSILARRFFAASPMASILSLVGPQHLDGPTEIRIEEFAAAFPIGQLDPEPEARPDRMDPRVHQVLAALDPQVRREFLAWDRPDVDGTVQAGGAVRIVAFHDAVPVGLVRLGHDGYQRLQSPLYWPDRGRISMAYDDPKLPQAVLRGENLYVGDDREGNFRDPGHTFDLIVTDLDGGLEPEDWGNSRGPTPEPPSISVCTGAPSSRGDQIRRRRLRHRQERQDRVPSADRRRG